VSQLFICGGLHPPLRHPTQVFFIADATCLPGAMTDAFLSAFGNVGSHEELQKMRPHATIASSVQKE
jgi:hypothetical protein